MISLKAMRKQQSRHKLVMENLNITSLTGKEHEWVEEAKRYSWLLLESFRQSFVATTLLCWSMGGNSSAQALIQKVFHGLSGCP